MRREYVLIVLGCVLRFDGEAVPDGMIKVFDIRTMRQLPALAFRGGRVAMAAAGPTMLKYLSRHCI